MKTVYLLPLTLGFFTFQAHAYDTGYWQHTRPLGANQYLYEGIAVSNVSGGSLAVLSEVIDLTEPIIDGNIVLTDPYHIPPEFHFDKAKWITNVAPNAEIIRSSIADGLPQTQFDDGGKVVLSSTPNQVECKAKGISKFVTNNGGGKTLTACVDGVFSFMTLSNLKRFTRSLKILSQISVNWETSVNSEAGNAGPKQLTLC